MPREDLLEVYEGLHILEEAFEKPTIEKEGLGSMGKAKRGTRRSSGKTRRKEQQGLPTWDPNIVAKSSLGRRPGLSQFLEFRELKKPPGLTFDIPTMSLSVSPDFMRNLHFHKATHHKARPWIEKACLQRAVNWTVLDETDMNRLVKSYKTMNRTSKRHRGNVFAQPSLLHNAASSLQKHRHEPSFVRWSRNVAPILPERLYGHLDGIVPEDVEIYIEDHKSYVKGHPDRIASCIWVSINAYWSVSMRACEALAIGNQPHPDWDIMTPVLVNFSTWFKETYHNQSENAKEYRKNNSHNPRRFLPLLRDMIPPGHDIPVVFAFRQKYLLFILKGGIEGELVAQYASHWLPIKEASKLDVDKEINELQLARLRDGEPEDAKTKTSGGPLSAEAMVKADPEWTNPILTSQMFEASMDERRSRKKTTPPPRKVRPSRLLSFDDELLLLVQHLTSDTSDK